jgi:xanthine dehydrogenase iron-sulfur cluster and FAD-binding subunit A
VGREKKNCRFALSERRLYPAASFQGKFAIMSKQVSFILNGHAVTVDDPSHDLLQIDYLRSPVVALAGPKKPCGQGGCGGCTVILSNWDE